MYCPNCGNKMDDDAYFCDSCGHRLKKQAETVELHKKAEGGQDAKIKFTDVLWKKYLEIAKAEGAEAEKYHKYSSDAVWDLLARFYINAFNNLTEEYKTDLDKQPYKAIEAIKTHLNIFVLSSYQVYLAEKLLKNDKIKKVEIKDPEVLAKEWKSVYLNHTNKIIKMSDDVLMVLDGVNNLLVDGLFNANPTLKDLPKAVVDGVKDQLIQQLIHGYLLGVAENNIRENLS